MPLKRPKIVEERAYFETRARRCLVAGESSGVVYWQLFETSKR